MLRLVCVHDGAKHMIAGARHTLGEHATTPTSIVLDSGSNMNAWDHLPNAKHIDWVLASVKQYPDIWTSALGAHPRPRARARADAARYAAWRAACAAARYAAWRAAYDATDDATDDAARVIGTSATLALIVYDDCAHLLEMSSDRLRMWASLTEQPAAVLLLPAVIARERIAQLESA